MNLTSELSNYGINGRGGSVRWFRRAITPELIDYLDLVETGGSAARDPLLPDGVVENQERPLLYFVNESRLPAASEDKDTQLSNLRRGLACRGDRAYLAVVRPGSLEVTPVSLRDRTDDWRIYQSGSSEAKTFFSRLALGRCEDLPSGPDGDFIFREMFHLVDRTATRLDQLHLKRTDIISLVGRVLFFRFLQDRGIIGEGDCGRISPHADTLARCFSDARNAAASSRWLDQTFNGDFLPLTDGGGTEFFAALEQRTGQRVFAHLTGVVSGDEPAGDDGFQLRLPIRWSHLDFAHIPVGLLSQVYERLSWKWDTRNARATSVHYTPRNIAATLVGEAFDSLPGASTAKVLDPACGAGIFLVMAFRRIYREAWKTTPDERPDTQAIRRILENQLVGFDISDSALKLTALSLYLTAIELDPNPVPVEKLKFRALRSERNGVLLKLKFRALRSERNGVLFDWRRPGDKPDGPVVGSIGNHVGDHFDGLFDLVMSNPPWTIIPAKYPAVSAELDEVSRSIVTSLDPEIGATYRNPDSVPDLPFVWRATRWCKPGGRIAMALPARLLFKQGKMAEATRSAVFRLLEVNGILNASNLRKTKVWPDMDQPSMLLFARNQRPKPGHRVRFISPHTDSAANGLGEMRLDAEAAQHVEVEAAIEEPWLWKALAVGTALDVEVVRKIKSSGAVPLEEYWEKRLGLVCRNGYQVRPNRKPQQDAAAMGELKDLQASSDFDFLVDSRRLVKFSRPTLGWSRIRYGDAVDELRVYRGPLVLIRVAPGEDRTEGRALLCLEDVAYSESYYGYSAAHHPAAELLARYLHLLVHSNLVMYHALMTSAEIGIERPKFQKRDFDGFPIFPFDELSNEQQRTVRELSDLLTTCNPSAFPAIDRFFGGLYGLSPLDMEVIADTLTTREPNDELGIRASTPPYPVERQVFMLRMESILRPLFKVLGKQPQVKLWNPAERMASPFVILTLAAKGRPAPEPSDVLSHSVLPLANESGATRIIKEADGALIIGILRQYRYWTPSRARMLCAEIIRKHLTLFED